MRKKYNKEMTWTKKRRKNYSETCGLVSFTQILFVEQVWDKRKKNTRVSREGFNYVDRGEVWLWWHDGPKFRIMKSKSKVSISSIFVFMCPAKHFFLQNFKVQILVFIFTHLQTKLNQIKKCFLNSNSNQ